MPKQSRRKTYKRRKGKDQKRGNKNPELTKRRLMERIERDRAKLAALEAAEDPAEQPPQAAANNDADADDADGSGMDHGLNRLVVKYFWQQLGSESEKSEWHGRDGVIAAIRRRMGAGAPTARTVERTLERLVEDEHVDLTSTRHAGGRPRVFSEEDDLYCGLVLCEGHSQRSATFIINGDRASQGLPPIHHGVIERAEERVHLIRRRRRSEKSGSSDLESAWCKGSLAFAMQVQMQLRAGAELARRPIVGPIIKLSSRRQVACLPSDEWGLLGFVIKVHGSWWKGLAGADRKKTWSCKLIGFVDAYSWGANDTTAAYVVENESAAWGTTRYPMRAHDAWGYLTQQQRRDVQAAEEARKATPPPFTMEMILVLDQHHRKCRLGKSSTFDCKLPLKDGKFCRTDDGGEYPEWSNRKSVKHPKEARLHFGVMMKRDAGGVLRGYKMRPFDYTDKWIVGVKRIEQEVKAVVDKANRLKATHGSWSRTKHYTREELAKLEGGRWEAWFIETYGSGDGWRDAVLKKVESGDHALLSVTKLMQHSIDEGNRLFADTPYADTWMINSDRLSAWWEVEAQDYLEERGFKDRQVRAWGDTNSEYWRYHEAVVGDRPELCALDFHLFEDLDYATDQNIINTTSLPVADEADLEDDDLGLGLCYNDGTPRQLSWAMRRTWVHNPSSERIVEDISRYPLVIDRIIECEGGVVPDFTMQHAGCSKRKRKATDPSRIYVMSPEIATVAADRRQALRAEAQRMLS